MTGHIDARLAERHLLPDEHLVDSGYPSAELLVSSLATFGVALVTPLLADTSPQARADAGSGRTAFAIDFGAQQATCPQGHASSSVEPRRPAWHRHDRDHFREGHLRALPGPGPVHHLGVRAPSLTVHPQQVHQAQLAARATQGTKDALEAVEEVLTVIRLFAIRHFAILTTLCLDPVLNFPRDNRPRQPP